ncbi:hypothetical protein CVT25_008895 [Psilocybe cyanescens]|uniref:Uncharacterized protein n=1 Tax=Psilocybe cyanescens TaxID=93625 RepID=A0A409XNH7_PSICY|nr:hypothetical protein CVT25_008895 [Psilocybe cyanescens]
MTHCAQGGFNKKGDEGGVTRVVEDILVRLSTSSTDVLREDAPEQTLEPSEDGGEGNMLGRSEKNDPSNSDKHDLEGYQ